MQVWFLKNPPTFPSISVPVSDSYSIEGPFSSFKSPKFRLTSGYVSSISFTVFKMKPIRGRQSSKGHNFSFQLGIIVSFAGGQRGTKWPTSKDATRPAPSPICIIHGVFSRWNTEGQFVTPLVEIRKKKSFTCLSLSLAVSQFTIKDHKFQDNANIP